MKKNSVIIIYSLVGLFLCSLGFFVISFTYSSLENISVMNFQARIDEYDKKEKKFIKLEENYKEWKKIDKTYAQFKDSYLIKFYDYPDFRNELRSIVSQNGLQLEEMKHKYRNMMDDIRKVSLDLRLLGSYMNLKKFVYEIENNNKMILFKQFQLNKRDTLNVEARISMEVYFVR